MGKGHIAFETLSFTEPRYSLPTPRVSLRDEGVLIQRSKVKRTKNLRPKRWSRKVNGEHMLLTPRQSVPGDRLLVAGAPHSALVGLP